MARTEVSATLSRREINGFRRRAKNFSGFERAERYSQAIELEKFPKTFEAFDIGDDMMHRVGGGWGDLQVDEEMLLNRFPLDPPVWTHSYYSGRVFAVITCGERFSVDFPGQLDLRRKLAEEIVDFDWFRGKFRLRETAEGYLIIPKESSQGILRMDKELIFEECISECRPTVRQGNLLYWSKEDKLIVQGMGIRDQLNCRGKLEEQVLNGCLEERGLCTEPKGKRELKRFHEHLDASMMNWNWHLELTVGGKVHLDNFKEFTRKSKVFFTLLFRIQNKDDGEVECYVNYDEDEPLGANEPFEIFLVSDRSGKETNQYCINVLQKLTGKRVVSVERERITQF